jgi:hypothetical protein
VQDGAGALYCGVHGLHLPGALPGWAGRPSQHCNYVCRMGLVPCIAVSMGYILLVLFLAELARRLVAPLNAVIMCAGWGWCPVLRCPRATSCWCSSWLSCYCIRYCVCRMGLVPCIVVSTSYILLVLFLALLLLNKIMCVSVCRMGLVPCIAVSTGHILLVLFLAELARRLVAPLNTVIMCAGWGWCPVLRCPWAKSCWCSSLPS